MTSRNDILASMRTLTVTTGVLPSMDDIARATGLSTGGLIHHFPTRSAWVDGLIGQAIAELDAAIVDAAAAGHAAQTWLRLSVPTGEERELYRAMTVALKALGATKIGSSPSAASAVVSAAISRWDAILTAELGDATTALMVRLIGDGLFLLSDAGREPGRDGRLSNLGLAIIHDGGSANESEGGRRSARVAPPCGGLHARRCSFQPRREGAGSVFSYGSDLWCRGASYGAQSPARRSRTAPGFDETYSVLTRLPGTGRRRCLVGSR